MLRVGHRLACSFLWHATCSQVRMTFSCSTFRLVSLPHACKLPSLTTAYSMRQLLDHSPRHCCSPLDALRCSGPDPNRRLKSCPVMCTPLLLYIPQSCNLTCSYQHHSPPWRSDSGLAARQLGLCGCATHCADLHSLRAWTSPGRQGCDVYGAC